MSKKGQQSMFARIFLFAYSLLYADPINVHEFFPSKEIQQRAFVYKVRDGPVSEYTETLTIHE